jgi:hypothetical protein
MSAKRRSALYTCHYCQAEKAMYVTDTKVPKCSCGNRHWEVLPGKKMEISVEETEE